MDATTVSPRIPADALATRARTVHIGHALLTAFAAVFVAAGWLVGGLMFVIVFAVQSAQYGYRKGRGSPSAPPEPGPLA